MSESCEYVLRAGGEIVRRDIVERNVTINENVVNQLCTATVTTTRNVFEAFVNGDRSMVSTVTRGREFYCAFPLRSVVIRSPYRLTGGAMIPYFNSPHDPTLSLTWTPPASMRLRILAQMQSELSAPNRHRVMQVWMYAFDKEGGCYRLPLPNLYEDCKVCSGDQRVIWSETAQIAIQHFMEVFKSSPWNADLWTTVEESQTLFRFTPEGEGANQIFKPIVMDDWIRLTKKVATAFSLLVPL